jgi:hypothetical protein
VQISRKDQSVISTFSVSQHYRDEQLINSFIDYFDCGRIVKIKNGKYIEYRLSKFSDINEKIIPFFKKYTLKGEKLLNFEDFCKICDLKNNKLHLTKDGRSKINIIKSGMNLGRNNLALG